MELAPVSFSSKLCMETTAGIGEKGESPGLKIRTGGDRRVLAGPSVLFKKGGGGEGASTQGIHLIPWMALSKSFSMGLEFLIYKMGAPVETLNYLKLMPSYSLFPLLLLLLLFLSPGIPVSLLT